MINLFRNKKNRRKPELLLLYASQTGNAKTIAQQAFKFYKKEGLNPEIRDVSDFSARELADYRQVMMVISTSGQGVPPPSAGSFFRELHSPEMPDLSHVNYSVCALGDSSYKLFCEAGKTADRRMQELSACPLHPRVDCDADFSEKAVRWIKDNHKKLKKLRYHPEPAICAK